MQSLKLKITGKVYHTGYRYFIKQKASQLKISGFISYCSDQSVEILATGENDYLDVFIKYCRIGNKDSCVGGISMSQIPVVKLDSFEVVEDGTLIFNDPSPDLPL